MIILGKKTKLEDMPIMIFGIIVLILLFYFIDSLLYDYAKPIFMLDLLFYIIRCIYSLLALKRYLLLNNSVNRLYIQNNFEHKIVNITITSRIISFIFVLSPLSGLLLTIFNLNEAIEELHSKEKNITKDVTIFIVNEIKTLLSSLSWCNYNKIKESKSLDKLVKIYLDGYYTKEINEAINAFYMLVNNLYEESKKNENDEEEKLEAVLDKAGEKLIKFTQKLNKKFNKEYIDSTSLKVNNEYAKFNDSLNNISSKIDTHTSKKEI